MRRIGMNIVDMLPKAGNPRNSEGSFIELKDGRILFIYSYFDGESAEDAAHSCLSASCSSDNGLTWSSSQVILKPEEDNASNLMCASLLRMKNGDIGLFYLVKRGWDARLHLRRSSDEGRTWGKSSCCIPSMGYYVVNNDRVIRLSSGRIIIPAAFHRMKSGNPMDISSLDGRGLAIFYYSDDDGLTWKEADNILSVNAPHSQSGLQEPGVIELKNGALWAWCRTDLGRQYESFSVDNGETWSNPGPSIFTSPCSPLTIKRIPDNGYLFAIWNPKPFNDIDKWPWFWEPRTPLVGAYSKDEGKTWSKYFVIEDADDGEYCYTAVCFINDGVLLAYCAGGKAEGAAEAGICMFALRIIKIKYSEFLHTT